MATVVLALGGCDRSPPSQPSRAAGQANASESNPLTSARTHLRRGDPATAQRLIQDYLLVTPKDAEALELAADAAIGLGQGKQAVKHLQAAVEASPMPSVELLDRLGRQWMAVGRPYESVAVLQQAVEKYPDQPSLRRDLGGLQASLGLEHAAAPHLQWLVQRNHGNPNVLIMLSDLARPQTDEATCKHALSTYPDDLRPQYALARMKAYRSQWKSVASDLQPVTRRHPEFAVAQAYYIRALVEIDDESGVHDWGQSHPEGVEAFPQYWLAVGIWAEKQNQPEQAARAFWEAVKRDENRGESLSRLASALAGIGRVDQSRIVAERAGKITAMRDAVESLFSWRNNSQQAAVKIAAAMEDLGRQWEAAAWVQSAFKMTQQPVANLAEEFADVRSRMTGQTPWQSPEALVSRRIAVDDLPRFAWRADSIRQAAATDQRPLSKIRFEDQAAKRQLHHTCQLGPTAGDESGLWIYQSGAGGAAVVDYDHDAWPDLYLTNINGTPGSRDSDPNRLYRNLAGQFLDVTEASGLGDRGFSQGLAIGDYNADGFADVMVANIGRNHLYRNNGDGTFTDVTEQCGLSGERWTSSIILVDVDGDAHADLFEVGYCGGEVLSQPCIDSKLDEPRSCKPMSFPAERDRVWRGLGDGTFQEVTDTWLGEHRPGRGLGVVAGNLDEAPGLDLLIANDMTANHWWSRTGSTDDPFQLSEQGVIRGIGVDARSLSQASMGIAAADADQDGDLDFYLTHFTAEYNTFYEQVSPGQWIDRTTQLGLAAPTHDLLAYGTQWLDADNDGQPELMVANGNIDDFSHTGKSFRMPMQVFRRGQRGRWTAIAPAELGEHFQQKKIGRSLVVLDVNRDGKNDALVTQLFDPVALLVNQSESQGASIRLSFRGTKDHPDAIGTRVSALIAGRQVSAQLLAGDGYQCSNERQIHLGLGEATAAKDVTIVWPDGERESLGTIRGGGNYLVIEGSGEAFLLK